MASKWKETVACSFDARADVYEQHSDLQKTVAQTLADGLPELDTPDVLEIGCGTGGLTRHLCKKYKGGNFHITDISPQMLADARMNAKSENIKWEVMDGENPPETNKRYDLIVSNMAFQWFENLEQALERLRSLLKPGGVLLYSIPSSKSFKEWHTVLAELSLPAGTLNFDKPASIVKEEELVIQYANTHAFLKNMKQLGAHTPREGYQKLNAAQLRKACSVTDEKFQGKITWHILYGRLQR